MATIRAVLTEAMRAMRAIAQGESPTADDLASGLEAASDLLAHLSEARGPLFEVEVSSDYVAGEDQRVRIVAGATVNVTLPNSVAMRWQYDPYDYGFTGNASTPPAGSTAAADNISFRAPRDGARVEVIGTSQGVYFYRSDLNQWLPVTGLTIDSELPISQRLSSAFGALLAERLYDVFTTAPAMSPTLTRRVGMARQALFIQAGRQHTRRVGEYF